MAAAPEPHDVVDISCDSESVATAKINAALASPMDIDFTEAPLRDVVAKLKARHKIDILLDLAGLKDAGVDSETPVTKRLSGTNLRSALRLLLDDLNWNMSYTTRCCLLRRP